MIVVRLFIQPSSWWRRLLEKRTSLRGCTMSDGSERKFSVREYTDTLALLDTESGATVCVPRGYQLVIDVAER